MPNVGDTVTVRLWEQYPDYTLVPGIIVELGAHHQWGVTDDLLVDIGDECPIWLCWDDIQCEPDVAL